MSVYLPKGPNDQNTEWLRTVQDQQHGKWIIGGDFNAHSPFWEKDCSNITSNRFVENIVDSSFYLLNDGTVTRIPDVSKHRATAIDLTLISPELVPSCSWETYKDTLGSDHMPIIITVSNESIQYDNNIDDIIPKFNFARANWKLFQDVLICQDFKSHENECVDAMFTKFKESVLLAANLSIPKLKTVKSSDHIGNVWWTDSCERAVQCKRQIFKTYLKDRKPEDHDKMKKANIQSNMTIAQAKQKYWTSFCTKEISDHKDFKKVWKKMKEMKNGITLPSCPITFDVHNKFPTDIEKAEAFVNMFAKNSSIDGLTSECKNYREQEEQNSLYTDPIPQNELWFNSPITLDEVKYAITSLKNKKSSVGIDAISNEMLKRLPENCINFLHKILENCWVSGSVPQVWKASIVIPILKEIGRAHV